MQVCGNNVLVCTAALPTPFSTPGQLSAALISCSRRAAGAAQRRCAMRRARWQGELRISPRHLSMPLLSVSPAAPPLPTPFYTPGQLSAAVISCFLLCVMCQAGRGSNSHLPLSGASFTISLTLHVLYLALALQVCGLGDETAEANKIRHCEPRAGMEAHSCIDLPGALQEF